MEGPGGCSRLREFVAWIELVYLLSCLIADALAMNGDFT